MNDHGLLPEEELAATGDRQFVSALARGLEILRCFGPDDAMLGNQELARRTGLPNATVSRLTHTLCRLGYLIHAERLGKYRPGAALLALGYAGLAHTGIRERARPLMQQLAAQTGASVALGTRDRLNMIYLEHADGASVMTLRLQVGARIPMATTALGRAFLAALPKAERAYLMEHMARRYGRQWPRVRRGIEQALAHCAEHGYCLAGGEWQPDVHAVGVACVFADGSGTVAFNCGGPRFLVSRDQLERDIAPRLVHLAHTLQGAMDTPVERRPLPRRRETP